MIDGIRYRFGRHRSLLVGLLLTGCGADGNGAPSDLAAGGQGGAGSAGAAGAAGTGGPAGIAGAPACEAAVGPFGANPDEAHSFPDLQVARCDGARITLDELRCRRELTLVSVGAGWCEPCREEAPLLQAIHEELGDRVEVVMVLFQDADGQPATSLFCDSWADNFSLTHPVVIDPTAGTLEYFDVVATPLNLLMNREGKVLWSRVGGAPEDLAAIVEAHLSPQPGD